MRSFPGSPVFALVSSTSFATHFLFKIRSSQPPQKSHFTDSRITNAAMPLMTPAVLGVLTGHLPLHAKDPIVWKCDLNTSQLGYNQVDFADSE
ncbi:hypothetical protein BDW42DRAFT_113408 [Aspergillus taichungensis]|uniref:Uncharacterized protein n=1 Tax=Aspergillus taichungensis TaxID=482145 RepID=A0A2J5HSR1_9EURO|nr:hypothetical protein BDW42DRAFT_113408 [Aspergillus taichungensis]